MTGLGFSILDRIDLPLTLFGILFVSLIVVSSITDLRTGRLPDWQNLLIFVGGLGFSLTPRGPGLVDGLVAGFLASAALIVVAWTYRRLSRRDALGGGDIKFVGACGPWIGVFGLAPMIFVAATSALAFVAVLAAFGKPISTATEVRFGPFLAVGALTIWVAQVSNLAPIIFGKSLFIG